MASIKQFQLVAEYSGMASIKQFQLVAEYSGMASIKQMHSYASNPTNLAIVVASSIPDKAEKFERIYSTLAAKHGDVFPYLTTLNPGALLPLSTCEVHGQLGDFLERCVYGGDISEDNQKNFRCMSRGKIIW